MQTFDVYLKEKQTFDVYLKEQQGFDVYLKKRLTEIDATITQLVQRETFSLFNRLYLFCVLSELELIKQLSGETSMELDAKISHLLETVHERMERDLYLDAEAMLTNKMFGGGHAGMVLSVDMAEAIKRDMIRSESVMELSAGVLDYYIAHSFGTVDFDMMMAAEDLTFLKEGFERFDSGFTISAESVFFSEKIADFEDMDMMLYTEPAGLFYATFAEGETEFYLSASPIPEYFLEKVLHDLDAMTALSASIDSILYLDKFAEGENILRIFARITEVLIGMIVPAESDMELICEASAEMKKYRLVSELDDFVLSELDNMALSELDFITIA